MKLRGSVPEMTLKYDLPRVGHLRLYDRAGKKGTLWRCRLCGRTFKVDGLWPHFGVELLVNEACRSWLAQNVGGSWKTLGEMHRDAANYAGCAIQTAARWLYQYMGPGQEYELLEYEDAYTFALRGGKP